MVEAATTSSAAAPALPQAVPPQPNWDAMANSFASLSTAIAVASAVFALIVFLVGLQWSVFFKAKVANDAKNEARKFATSEAKHWAEAAKKDAAAGAIAEARRCAEDWLTQNGPLIFGKYGGAISGVTLDDGGGIDAEEIGKNAGDETG